MYTQPAILLAAPRVARYLSFCIGPGVAADASMVTIQALDIDDRMVVGIGEALISLHYPSLTEI